MSREYQSALREIGIDGMSELDVLWVTTSSKLVWIYLDEETTEVQSGEHQENHGRCINQ